jgi:8-oxo-dGTP pyrophosphatase MutT (NUDIX family)
MLPLPKIVKSVSPLLNGEFEIISLSKDQEKTDHISSKANYIAILPFEKTSDDKIKSIYCLRSDNPATGQTDTTLIVDQVDPARDQTPYDSVCRAMIEEAGIDLDEIGITGSEIFYLGTITSSVPVSAKFKCYAVDLTKVAKSDKQIEFARTLSKSKFTKDSSEIVKLGFHQVVNGDFSDSTILSGAFLLVSYFN